VTKEIPWKRSFEIDGDPSGGIQLKQLDKRTFKLGSRIEYIGADTGLEGRLDSSAIEQLRWVSGERLPDGTDLASVPLPLRWLVSNYGAHTPAALIHDWMIVKGPPVVKGLTPQYADRYFRFMLRDLRVRWIRRWMMWAAVALRTRWVTGARHKILLVVWVIAALAGMGAFVAGFVIGSPWLVVVATFAPFAFSLLWGRQYGAGLVASYNAPWVLPPTVIGLIGYGIYAGLEWLVSKLSRGGSGDQPYGYQDF